MNTEHFEIERKYLIAYPSLEMLKACAEDTQIVQTYLVAPEGETARVRKRGRGGQYVYTHTVKKRISDLTRIEDERVVDEAEYHRLLKTADPKRNVIYKTRWCLPYQGQIFEIDLFPFWEDRAIMEIEMENEEQEILFPPQITVLREVSQDGRYTNSALSTQIPYDEL